MDLNHPQPPSVNAKRSEYTSRRDGRARFLIRSRCGLAFVRAHQGHVHQVLGEKPHLQLIGADHVGNEQIVCPIVAGLARLPGHGPGFLQDRLMRLQQARNLHWRFFAAARRPGDDR